MAEAFSRFPCLVQAVCNTSSQIHEGENWIQLLLKIKDKAEEYANKNVVREIVTKSVAKTQPPRVEHHLFFVSFVKERCGLLTTSFVDQLDTVASPNPSKN